RSSRSRPSTGAGARSGATRTTKRGTAGPAERAVKGSASTARAGTAQAAWRTGDLIRGLLISRHGTALELGAGSSQQGQGGLALGGGVPALVGGDLLLHAADPGDEVSGVLAGPRRPRRALDPDRARARERVEVEHGQPRAVAVRAQHVPGGGGRR